MDAILSDRVADACAELCKDGATITGTAKALKMDRTILTKWIRLGRNGDPIYAELARLADEVVARRSRPKKGKSGWFGLCGTT